MNKQIKKTDSPIDGNRDGTHLLQKTVAAFDFDLTLTSKHSFWRFLRYVSGPIKFWWICMTLLPTVVLVLLKRLTYMEAREVFIDKYLTNLPENEMYRASQYFAKEVIPQWIRKEALERIRWHQGKGHLTVIVSNAPEDYLAPWAESVGINHVLGSRFEKIEGKLTGRLKGTHCYGPEKVNRLTELLGNLGEYCVYAYGDNAGDRELLAAADYSFLRTFKDDQTAA